MQAIASEHCASGKGLSPTFYSRKGPYWRTTHDAKVAALTSAIMQILYKVQSHLSVQLKDIHPVFFLKIFRVQLVWRIQSNHFSGIFYQEKGSFRISDLIKPADILMNKI